jgi:hypothetical protein
MASGHVNRINRPNTWLHRPMLATRAVASAGPTPGMSSSRRLASLERCQALIIRFELQSFAWIAPPNRGSSNSTHIHGTHVPVEEPSTASEGDVRIKVLFNECPFPQPDQALISPDWIRVPASPAIAG